MVKKYIPSLYRISKDPRNYKYDDQYREWRAAVRKRDGYKCQFPGCCSKTKLQVHHIRKWADNPGIRYLTSNGITLCRTHHQQIWNKEDDFIPVFLAVLNKNEALKSKKNSK